MSNISNLSSCNEKLVKYAVLRIDYSARSDLFRINSIDCNKKHIFDSEELADQFCDHANKSEVHEYQYIVKQIIIDTNN